MRRRLLSACAVAVSVLVTFGLDAQSSPPAKPLVDVLPPNAASDSFVVTPDAARTYFLNASGEIWCLDRAKKTTARIAAGPAWDVSVSAAQNAIAFTQRGDAPNDRFVWIVALDPKTGLAAGAARRVSSAQSDVPALSPDGRSIAFARDDPGGVTQRVVVAPVAGGPERAVSGPLPSIDHIRWTADSASLYFGVNPPVACVPEWSCLPLPKDDSKGPTTIRRAAVSGGTDTTIIPATRTGAFGLSPDGSIIVFADPKNARTLNVADPEGRVLGSFTPPSNQTIVGWLGGSSLLTRSSGVVRRLDLVPLAGGTPRPLFENGDRISPPAWSDDGKMIAALRCPGTTPCEVRLLNANGTPLRAIPMAETYANTMAWSPDSKWISFAGSRPNEPQRISAIELATGRTVALADVKPGAPTFVLWLPDSTRVMVSEPVGSGAKRSMAFRAVDMNGQSAPEGEVVLGDQPGSAIAINPTTVLLAGGPAHNFRLAALPGPGAEREIFSGVDQRTAVLSLSADRQWLALRRMDGPEADGFNTLDICRADGSGRATVRLPFFATPTATGLAILPGGASVVVVEAFRQDVDPGVYLVTIATKSVKKLFTFPAKPSRSGVAEVSVSPDGRTLGYSAAESMAASVSTLDLSVFRRPGR